MKKTILFILALMPMIAMADSGKCGNKVYSVTSMIESPFSVSTVFDNEVYASAALHIPYGTLNKYMTTEGWMNFKNIAEGPTAVNNVQQSVSQNIGEIYQTNGMKSPTLQHGINIIRMSDGTVRKVMK